MKTTLKFSFAALLAILMLSNCQQKSTETLAGSGEIIADEDLNYPAEGFNIEGSNPIAITIADKVMNAMGGRKNWNETQYIYWNFFGARTLLWDKKNEIARVESLRDDFKAIVDLKTNEGRVYKDGQELTDADSLAKYLDRAKRIWINDSYWLVMPFKLKDTGVTLSYLGEGATETGEAAYVLRLTFEGVGVTPQNAYNVWVSNETSLVKQWAYYPNATDENPGFTLPWEDYFQAGNIMLSGERGERDLTDIKVLREVPAEIFTSFDTVL